MFSRNMLNDRLSRNRPPPSCFGVADSPDSGSFRYAHAMNAHEASDSTPMIDITDAREPPPHGRALEHVLQPVGHHDRGGRGHAERQDEAEDADERLER